MGGQCLCLSLLPPTRGRGPIGVRIGASVDSVDGNSAMSQAAQVYCAVTTSAVILHGILLPVALAAMDLNPPVLRGEALDRRVQLIGEGGSRSHPPTRTK